MDGKVFLEQLKEDDDRIGKFITDDGGTGWYIIPNYMTDTIDHIDLSACLEYTLHELITAGYDDLDIAEILHAKQVENDDELFNDGICIDLGYMIVNLIVDVEEV